jgi:hypothetical protein
VAIITIAFVWFVFTRDTIYVYDAHTQMPVVGVRVQLIHPSFAGRSCMTNSRGMVTLWEGLPWYSVEFVKDGYYSETLFTAVPANREHHLKMALKPK